MRKITVLLLSVACYAWAQCPDIPRSNNGSTWPTGSTVTIYVNTSQITDPLAVAGIQQAVTAWNKAGTSFTMSVTPFSGTVNPSGNYLIVGIASEGTVKADTQWTVANGYTNHGTSNFDPTFLTNYSQSFMQTAWAMTMSHEFGHPAGLGDCGTPDCSGSSTMSKTASTIGPTPCDMTAYNKYKPLKPKSNQGKGGGCGSDQ